MAKNVPGNCSDAPSTDSALEAIAILTRSTKTPPVNRFRHRRFQLPQSGLRSSLKREDSKRFKFNRRVLINEGPTVTEFEQLSCSEESANDSLESSDSEFELEEEICNYTYEELKLRNLTEKNTVLNRDFLTEFNGNSTKNLKKSESAVVKKDEGRRSNILAKLDFNDVRAVDSVNGNNNTNTNNTSVKNPSLDDESLLNRMERNGKATHFGGGSDVATKPVASFRTSLASKPAVGAKPSPAAKPWLKHSPKEEPKPQESQASTIRLVSKRFEAVELKKQPDHSVDNEEFYEKYGVIKVTRDGNDNQNNVRVELDEPKQSDVPRSYRLVSKAPVKLVMPENLENWTTMTLQSETLGGEERVVPAITDEEARDLQIEEEEEQSSEEESVKDTTMPSSSELNSSVDDGVNNNRDVNVNVNVNSVKKADVMSSSLTEDTERELINPIEFSMLSAEAPDIGRPEKKKKKGGKEFFKRLLRRGDREEKPEPKEGALVSTWSDPGLLDEEDPPPVKRSDMNGRPLPSVDGSWMNDVLKVLNIGNENGESSDADPISEEKKVDFLVGEEEEEIDSGIRTSRSVSSSPALGKKLKKPRQRSDVSNSPNKIFDAMKGRSRRNTDEGERMDEKSESGRGLTALDLVDMHVRRQAEMNDDNGDRKFQTLPTRGAMKKRATLDMSSSTTSSAAQPASPTSGKPVTHPPKPTAPPPPIPEDAPSRNGSSPTREIVTSPRKPARPMSTMESRSKSADVPPPVPVTSRPSHRPERPPPPRLFRASTSDMPHPPMPPVPPIGRNGDPLYEMYGTRSGNSMKNTYDYIEADQLPAQPDPAHLAKMGKKSMFSRANIKKSFSLSDKQRKLPFLPKSKKNKTYEEIPGLQRSAKACSPDQYEDLDVDDLDGMEVQHEENIYDPIDTPPVPNYDPSLSSPVDGIPPEEYLIPTSQNTPPPVKRQAPKPQERLLHRSVVQARNDEDGVGSTGSSTDEYVDVNEQASTTSASDNMEPLIALNQATLAVLGTISQMNLDTLKKAVLDFERQQKHVLVGSGQRFLEYELKSEVPLVQNADTRFYKAIVKRNRQQCVILLTNEYLPDVLVSPKCPNGFRQCLAFEDFVSTRLLPPNPKELPRNHNIGQSRPTPAITRGKINVLKYNDLMSLDKFLDIVSANKDENYFCNVAFILIQILFLGAHFLQHGKLFRELSLSGIVVVPSSEGTHIQVLIDPSYIHDESASESGLQSLSSQLLSLIKITLLDEKAEPQKIDSISLDVYQRVRGLLCAVLKSNHPNNLFKCVDVLGFILWGPFGDSLDMINSTSLEMECQNWLDTEYAKDVNRLARGEMIDSTWTYFKLKYLCQMEGGATIANVIRSLKDCLEPP